MLYQLSHVRRDAHPSKVGPSGKKRDGTSARWGPEVDGEREDTVVERGARITDDGEILEVELGLLDESGPFLPGDRRKGAILDRVGAITEPLEHCIEVESVSHVPTLDRPGRNRA